jgi:uncharacterized protein (DUF2236 family)
MSRPRYKQPSGEDIVDRQFFIKNQHDEVVVNDDGQELIGALVDDRSITKRNLGKIMYGAQLGIGIEQLLHPEVGTTVEHTGKFWGNPYKRVAVSVDPIMAVVYAEDPRAAGEYVQRLHQGVNGTDKNGQKFNALNPDTFYWTHETFRIGDERAAEHYSLEPFTDEDRAMQHLESNTWYSYYGMPMNMVPADYAANLSYRKHMIDDVLEMNPSAERAIDASLNHNPPRPEGVPKAVWTLAKIALVPVSEVVGLVTIGEMDPAIRKKFGIPFGRDDQKHLDELRTIAKAFIDPLPDPIRYTPMAYESLRRDRGGEHKSVPDAVIHRGLSLGSRAAMATLSRVKKAA